MRPILMTGHTRSITYVKYNKEGDLLFTASKDSFPAVWRSESGERLGTYDGHSGAVWCLDITNDSKLLLTGSADQTAKLWDVKTGKELFTFQHGGVVRGVAWAEGEREFATITDSFGTEVRASINIYQFASSPDNQSSSPALVITDPDNLKTKITKIAWLSLNRAILASYETGMLRLYDPKTGAILGQYKEHEASITSFVLNEEKTLLATASTDRTAKLWDVQNMRVLRTYEADTPLNAVALSPVKEHIVVGGGQEARDVTTTIASAGKFESRFYHFIFCNELGRIKGHFGPINTLAFHPEGKSFASGGEDGYIRLHQLDSEYDQLGEDDDLDDPLLTKALEDGLLKTLEDEEAVAKKKAEETAAASALASKSMALSQATGSGRPIAVS